MKQITQIIDILGRDYAMSNSINTRLGGLIALAATTTALGKVSYLLNYSMCLSQLLRKVS